MPSSQKCVVAPTGRSWNTDQAGEAEPDTLFDVDDAEGLAKVRALLAAR